LKKVTKIKITQYPPNLGKSQIKQPQFCPEQLKQIDMATSIITPDDLEQFKWELLADIKEYLKENYQKVPPVQETEWIKSHQVQRLLGISPGTLQNLRINGTIPYSKVGGVLFYKKKDIQNILEQNMRNREE
jgi:hypothetical protein